MKKAVFVLYLALLSVAGFCQQNPDDQAVRDVVNKLFKAMELGDSTMARQVFASEVTAATIFRDKENKVKVHRESSIDDFVKQIGSPHPTLYEETWNLTVQIDGDFAQAWCDYAFYIGHKFSHCGVDALHLVKESDGWKVFHLADTRRKTNCDIPKDIQNKHQQ